MIPLDEFRIHLTAIGPIRHRTIVITGLLGSRRPHAEFLRVLLRLIRFDHFRPGGQEFLHTHIQVVGQTDRRLRRRSGREDRLTEFPQKRDFVSDRMRDSRCFRLSGGQPQQAIDH